MDGDWFFVFFIFGILFVIYLVSFIEKIKDKVKNASYKVKNYDKVLSQYNELRYEHANYISKHGDLEKLRLISEREHEEKLQFYEQSCQNRISNLEKLEKDLSEKIRKHDAEYKNKVLKLEQEFFDTKKSLTKKHELYMQHIEQNIYMLLADKTISMPWLATMISDYYDFVVDETRCKVTNVSGLKNEITSLKKQNKLLEYNLEYIKSLVPEIEDNVVDFSEKATDFEYLTKEEFNSLSVGEKNKLALERYKKNRRGKHNIGRDFEMYIGYVLENKGFQVEYFGIEKKLQDLGRDLIAEDDTTIYIIQCKYWSKGKLIHEKHICQLYGTYVKFKLENKTNKKIVPVFVCHNKVSDVAKEFAKELNVQIFENVDIKDYPMIKCNINTYIYHLPFDQQYDNLLKENCKMVSTVEEAYKLGCRRAYTWRGRV